MGGEGNQYKKAPPLPASPRLPDLSAFPLGCAVRQPGLRLPHTPVNASCDLLILGCKLAWEDPCS